MKYGREKRSTFRLAVCIAVAAISVGGWSAAVQAADFYAGKTLTVIINYGAGGPTDLEARLVVRHLGKHIPGNPSVIAKNMPGAGGLIATNFMGEVAKADGFTLAYLTPNFDSAVLKDPGLRVDLSKFRFVAGQRGAHLLHIRTDVAPGMKKAEDIVKAKSFVAAGLRVTSVKDLRTRLMLDILGVKYRYVTGFRGSVKVRAAIQRNEVQLYEEHISSYIAFVKPNLVDKGLSIPVCTYNLMTAQGPVRSDPNMPKEIMGCYELHQKIHGRPPSGLKWDAFNAINLFPTTMNRFIAFPPGTPDEPVRILRAATARLAKDPEYLADAKKRSRSAPRFLLGAEGQKVLEQGYAVSPKIVAFLNDYVAAAKKK